MALAMPLSLWAQDDPRLTVSTKKQVMVGERFQVVFEANADGKNFQAPSFDGFTVLGGPFTSSSSSFSMVNGSMSHSVKVTYTFALQAYKEGTFNVGSASLSVKGNKISSEPFDIKVVPDDGSHAAPSGGGSTGQGQSQQNTNDSQVSGEDLFLRVIPSKKSKFVGEQEVLDILLYTKTNIGNRYSITKGVSCSGAWVKEDYYSKLKPKSKNEFVNGIEYAVGEVGRIVVVPQRTGTIDVSSMTMVLDALVRIKREPSPMDVYLGGPLYYEKWITKEVSSNSVAINVKSLPENSKPVSFAGAVGNYKFTSSIDKTELSTNEAVTITLTVSGTGNIELLQMPQPVFPPDFEVYDPKISMTTDVTAQGITGTKKAEFLAIPRRAGKFSIPAIGFSYFNPNSESYQTLLSEPYELTVRKGKDTGDEGGGVFASNQEDIKYLGSDIRHIMGGDAKLKPVQTSFFASATYFVVLLALLLAFIILLIALKQREQLSQDTAANRNRKADKVARGRLKSAYNYLKSKDQEKFYVEMSQALWGYIADKLGIERSKLSMETVSETMKEKSVPDELTRQFVDTLNSCEFARFAPGSAEAKMEDLYQRGIEVISKAEKVL